MHYKEWTNILRYQHVSTATDKNDVNGPCLAGRCKHNTYALLFASSRSADTSLKELASPVPFSRLWTLMNISLRAELVWISTNLVFSFLLIRQIVNRKREKALMKHVLRTMISKIRVNVKITRKYPLVNRSIGGGLYAWRNGRLRLIDIKILLFL